MTQKLSQLGISSQIIVCIRSRGISTLRPVQREAIQQGINGRSLVVTSPPGTGKTLIGEVLGFHKLQTNPTKKTVFLLPLRALARQKFRELKSYDRLGFQIGYTTGGQDLTSEAFDATDVLVATYERLDSFLRSWPEKFNQIGTVICDEIHEVGGASRGPRLEALLTRLMSTSDPPQIIGLSATIANPEMIANWLGASLVVTTERMPLQYHLLISTNKLATINKILIKSMKKENQVLIFVNTRSEAENLAMRLAQKNQSYLTRAQIIEITEKLSTHFLPQLEDPTTPTASNLLNCARRGVAWHHAGLATSERIAVEEAFAQRYLLILTATPTLAAGLNLPASTVIIKDLKLWDSRWISANDIHQRAGRAGRPLLDTEGHAFLFASDEEELEIADKKYFYTKQGEVLSRYEPITSHLADIESLREQILTRIVQCGTASRQDIVKMFQNSLWWTQKQSEGGTEHIDAYLFPASSPQYSLRIRGTPDRAKRIVGTKIIQKTPNRITGIVSTQQTQCTASFDLEKGAYCSCSNAAGLLQKGILCEHLTYLADKLLRTKEFFHAPPIARTLYELSPIYYLQNRGLIQEFEGAHYEATPLGRLAVQLYLKPSTMVLIRDSILTKPVRSQKEALRATLIVFQHERRAKIPSSLEDGIGLLEKWLNGLPYSQILGDQGIMYPGDLEGLASATTWLLSCLSRITNTLGEQLARYSDELHVLAKRMSEGLPENGVELKEHLGLTRRKTMALLRGGIRSIEDLKAIPPEELTELRRIPGIGNRTLRVIQKALATTSST